MCSRSPCHKVSAPLPCVVLFLLRPLLQSYLQAAKGAHVMFARTSGNEWVRVTDPATMERLLNSGESFYRFEQSKPDVRALVDAFDRLFGKPTQSVDVTADVNSNGEDHPYSLDGRLYLREVRI